jgi:uncharacterized membrane protein SirB2
MYLITKDLHVTMVVLSISLFLLRGLWMLRQSDLLRRSWVKIVPHVIDSILLVSAVTLAVLSAQYPLVQPWLTAKVVALVVYVGLGTLALKRGRTKTVRTTALVSAVAVFAYIVAVAITRSPWPWVAS